MHDYNRMDEYNRRPDRYEERPDNPRYPPPPDKPRYPSPPGRFPIAERSREERAYDHHPYGGDREPAPRYGDRFNDHYENGNGERPERRYDDRIREQLDMLKRDRNDYDGYNRDGYRERPPPRDRYSDYPPPGVDDYDDYNGMPPRDRHPRRPREFDRDFDRRDPPRDFYDRDRSPIRGEPRGEPRGDPRGDPRADPRDRYNADKYDDYRGAGSDDDFDRGGEKWIMDTPTNTIILRNLPNGSDEKDILKELSSWNVNPKDVRLMRKKASGVSRGFAFVEFKSTDEARHWMDTTQGRIQVRGQTVSLYYSSPKIALERTPESDWTCTKCCAHNFKRRDQCYVCGITRGESERYKDGDGFDQVGANPCNTLILRGLDALTTEHTLKKSIRSMTKKKPKNVKVMTDPLTATSLGFAFAEFASVKDTKQIMTIIQSPDNALEVDGKLVIVAYAKNTFSTILSQLESNAAAFSQSQWPQHSQQWDYNQSGGQYHDYSQHHYQSASTKAKPTNAALAQAAIEQAQAAKTSHKTPVGKIAKDAKYAVYPTPDVSKYQYDHTSGYYYDASTGLYYDANTQYYFNNQTNQFLYWCGEKSTYLPAPTDANTAPPPTTANKDNTPAEVNPVETKKDKEKSEKAKAAKKIAKDMERWAKSQNASKNVFTKPAEMPPPMAAPPSRGESASKSADAGFSMFEKSSRLDKQMMPPPPPSEGGDRGDSPGLVASYGGDSDDDDTNNTEEDIQITEESYLDWDKLICQLCKRQFNSPDMLMKHKNLSDLHKQNMATLIASKPSSKRSDVKYRDRASERRRKYGAPPPPDVKKPIAFPAPVDMGQPGTATQSVVANKMMQKMGWAEGQGLGKSAQGRVNPVEAKMRSATAGLGVRGASYDIPAGTMYKVAGKMSMFARYSENE